MKDGLPIWVVYDHPKDMPHLFVARRWLVNAKGQRATDLVLVHTEIEPLREQLEMRGLIKLDRQPGDDPVVMETWV